MGTGGAEVRARKARSFAIYCCHGVTSAASGGADCSVGPAPTAGVGGNAAPAGDSDGTSLLAGPGSTASDAAGMAPPAGNGAGTALRAGESAGTALPAGSEGGAGDGSGAGDIVGTELPAGEIAVCTGAEERMRARRSRIFAMYCCPVSGCDAMSLIL